MRVAEFKQIHTHTEQRVVHHDAEFDDTGNMTADAWDETVEVEIPVMGMVYRDATPEEVDDLERQQVGLSVDASTPVEYREIAYNTLPCVEWGGDMMTVTQAANQWAYYAAEGRTDKTDALTSLIAEAKQSIREQYPDE